MIRPDFYAVLGITPTASAEDVRQSFRLLARQYHPDANPGDPAAAEMFKVINEAYRVLSTPQLRAAYDHALRIVRPASGASQPGAMNGQTVSTSAASEPTGPGADAPATSRSTTQGPAYHRTGAPAAPAAPTLVIRVTPAQLSIVPPREPTRYYLLTELGSAREAAVFDPMALDLALVIDRSNSMRNQKIYETKRAVRNILDQLRTDDLLTLVFFEDRAEVLADGETVAGRAGIETALDGLSVRGGTVISSGLRAALERLATRQNRSRVASLVLLTDGRTYGDEAECLELAAHAREIGVSITAMGLGTDWNRDLLDRLAAISGGSAHFVERPIDLQTMFEDAVLRLRATLAAGMRLTYEPGPGIRIARVTRVAPDIAEAFSVPTESLASTALASGPVAVDLGALVGRPDIETAAVIWEMLLDPATFVPRDGAYDMGRLSATYWAPRQGGGQMERIEHVVALPVNATSQHAPVEPDVRLALELVTAYRLQAQADSLKAAGKVHEAAQRLNTAAIRLQSAGSASLADEARRAAQALGPDPEQGVTETLRARYGTKNLGMFHRLRQHHPTR